MTAAAPPRLHAYNGPITRAARWDSYRPRAGDIIISAPPKSGMTWTQAICAMLIFGRTDLDVQPARLSPWFDSNFEPLGQMLARLDAQTHRRYLKTHTPLDGLPYFPEVTYLAVYRHPLDAIYSAGTLALKVAEGNPRMRASLPADICSYMLEWICKPFVPGTGDQLSVTSLSHHLNTFWIRRELQNVYLLHYADLQRDLRAQIAALASVLGCDVSGEFAAAIAQSASFERMRAQASRFAPENLAGWKRPEDFFRGGGSGGWRPLLTDDDVAKYRQVLRMAVTDPNAVGWLENGSG